MEVHALNGESTLINRAVNNEPICVWIDCITLKLIGERAILMKLCICLSELVHGYDESCPMATFAGKMQKAASHHHEQCQNGYYDLELFHNGKRA